MLYSEESLKLVGQAYYTDNETECKQVVLMVLHKNDKLGRTGTKEVAYRWKSSTSSAWNFTQRPHKYADLKTVEKRLKKAREEEKRLACGRREHKKPSK